MAPLVSVIMSSYNHGRFVAEAVKSVLDQTFENFELLIADDHSTDDTADVIRGFSDPRITAFYFSENRGSRHVFLRQKAKGKYLAIIHSDDVWSPQKLETQVAYLESHPDCAACFTHVGLIDENSSSLADFDMDISVFRQPNRTQAQWVRHFFTSGNCLCHPSVLIRREIYEKLGIDRSLRQLPDFKKWITLVKKYPIHIVQKDMMFHRRHGKNMSATLPENNNRYFIETYFLSKFFFDGISDDIFCEAFSDLFRNPSAHTSVELTCEKYFLLLDHYYAGGYGRDLSAAAFFYKNCKNEDVLSVLKDTYHYTPREYHALIGSIGIDWCNRKRKEGNVYFDTGSGFSASESTVFSFLSQGRCVSWKGLLPDNCKAIRFDPVENAVCIVKSIAAHVGELELNPIPLNGLPMGDCVIFNTNDPQYFIEIPKNTQGELHISFDATIAEDKLESNIFSETFDLFSQEIERQVQRLEELKVSLVNIENSYNTIVNSFFWRVTRPLRAIKKLFNKLLTKK